MFHYVMRHPVTLTEEEHGAVVFHDIIDSPLITDRRHQEPPTAVPLALPLGQLYRLWLSPV